MANHRAALFLVVLSVSAMSVANSLLVIDNLTINLVTIVGTLNCTAPSTPPQPPPAAQPVAGINGGVACNGSPARLTQILTNPNGFFSITVDTVTDLLFDPTRCRVVVRLPVARCALYPGGAVLEYALKVVSVVPLGGVVGALSGVANLIALPLGSGL